MAVSVIEIRNKRYVLKLPGESERRYLKGLKKSSESYSKLLSLVINRKLTLNSFTGDIAHLNEIINEIKEAL